MVGRIENIYPNGKFIGSGKYTKKDTGALRNFSSCQQAHLNIILSSLSSLNNLSKDSFADKTAEKLCMKSTNRLEHGLGLLNPFIGLNIYRSRRSMVDAGIKATLHLQFAFRATTRDYQK